MNEDAQVLPGVFRDVIEPHIIPLGIESVRSKNFSTTGRAFEDAN